MESSQVLEISNIIKKFHELKEILLKILKQKPIICENYDENADKEVFIAKPRFQNTNNPISESLQQDIQDFYNFIKIFLNKIALEHFLFQVNPIFTRDATDPNYKSSIWILLKEDIYATDEVYGDYEIERCITNAGIKVSVFYKRRKKRRKALVKDKIFFSDSDIKNYISNDAQGQIINELGKRLDRIHQILVEIEHFAQNNDNIPIEGTMAQYHIDKLTKDIESHKCEFKQQFPEQVDNIAHTISAFANGKGGDIYFGISDKQHEIIGCDDYQSIEDRITGLIKSMELRPTLRYLLYHYSEDKFIIRAHINQSNDLISYKDICYYRDENSSSNRLMKIAEIKQRIRKSGSDKTKIIEKDTANEENKDEYVQKLFELLIQFIEYYFSDQPRLNIEQLKNFKPYFLYLGLVIRGSNSLEFLQGKYIFRPVSGYNPLIPLSQSFPPLRSRSFDIHLTYDVYPYATFESRLELYFEIIHWAKDEFSIDLYPPDDIFPNDIEYVKKILNNLISAIKANDPRQLSKDLNITKKKYLLLHYTNCNEILDRSKKQFRNLNEIQLDTYHLGYDYNEIKILNDEHPQQAWEVLSEGEKNLYRNELLLLFSRETINLEEYWINPEKKKKILQEFISAFEKDDWKTIYNITHNPTLKKFIIQFPEIILWKWEYVNNPLILKEGGFILSTFKDGIILEKKENNQIIKYKSTFYQTTDLKIKDDYIQMLKKLLV